MAVFRVDIPRSRKRLQIQVHRGVQVADRMIPMYRRVVYRELSRQLNILRAALERGVPFSEYEREFATRMFQTQAPLSYQIAARGREWTFDNVLMATRGKSLTTEITDPEELLAMFDTIPLQGRFLVPKIDRRLRDTVTVESRTRVRKMARVVKRGRDAGLNIATIGRTLRREGVVYNKHRADLLARTSVLWNHNAGAREAYRQAGVTVQEWSVSQDDLLCDACMEMEGVRVAIDQPFLRDNEELVLPDGGAYHSSLQVEHPPLHCFCRCGILPVVEDVLIREREMGRMARPIRPASAQSRILEELDITPQVQLLLDEYEVAKTAGDKALMKKLRSRLRRKGHYMSKKAPTIAKPTPKMPGPPKVKPEPKPKVGKPGEPRYAHLKMEDALTQVADDLQPMLDDIQRETQLIGKKIDELTAKIKVLDDETHRIYKGIKPPRNAWDDVDYLRVRKQGDLLRDERKVLRGGNKEVWWRRIQAENPVGKTEADFDILQYGGKEVGKRDQRKIRRLMDDMSRLVDQRAIGDTQMSRCGWHMTGTSRSSYNAWTGVNLERGAARHTMYHEFGHHIEHQSEHIRLRAIEFRNWFSGKGPKSWLGDSHDRGEIYREVLSSTGRKWPVNYCGKVYSSGLTEIISMGVELMEADPAGLYLKHPQYFRFMVGILHGLI